jgi:hypothetical protein
MAGRIPGMSGPLPRAGLVVLAGRSLETPCLDNRPADGGKIVSRTHRPNFTLQKQFLCFWYSFLVEAE